MNESTRGIITLILVLALLLAIAYLGATFMIRRATCTVIKIFRANGALSPVKTLSVKSLSLLPRGFFQFRDLRDYKPAALQCPVKANIVSSVENGWLYLDEEGRSRSGIGSHLQIVRRSKL